MRIPLPILGQLKGKNETSLYCQEKEIYSFQMLFRTKEENIEACCQVHSIYWDPLMGWVLPFQQEEQLTAGFNLLTSQIWTT